MRKQLLGLMLVGGLAGCTAEQAATSAAGPEAPPSLATRGSTPVAAAPVRDGDAVFASLPDRGELLAYGGARSVRTSGAYTYHPVAISEAHALGAIGGGEMVVNLPDGQALRLAYERHEEQPDGNWTWVGRDASGGSAVLTFGEKAVFGMVTRGDESWRVRSDRSGAWVVETDRNLVAVGGGKRESGSDFLLPPDARSLMSSVQRGVGQATRRSTADAAPTEKSTSIIDVLLGYSQGLATEVGSPAATSTYVANLVALTNDAYARSGVNQRLRLVHSMQVNYGDDSDNQDALQQMTGYDAEAQRPITPNTAFNGLRAAREEYGADLVALVRRYREPQQDGCGIAWLLGMNGSGITVADDADFAYAVVSAGEDRDESDGNTYFCSELSLAHELGHLMGQAHNQEDAAGSAGAHPYSYGFRESSSSGFHTIMAYPLNGTQTEIPFFANPQVNFAASRPTGVAGQSDNARSMNITMPIIANFRATVVAIPRAVSFDFNGDGISDVLWRNATTGQNQIWRSANNATQQAVSTVGNKAWQVVGVGDFNGDQVADILWRNVTTGRNEVWLSGNSAAKLPIATVANLSWQVAGVGDFNGDGRDDILWRNVATGQNQIWRSANNTTQQAVATVGNKAWQVVGVGDFNGDGVDDILWRNSSTGQNQIWRSANNATQQAVATVGNKAWRVVGIGDFNEDGRADILWRNGSTGQNQIWRSANNATQQAVTTVGNRAWEVVGVGDYDDDGVADILWRNSSTGQNQIWKSANSQTQQAVARVANPAWRAIWF